MGVQHFFWRSIASFASAPSFGRFSAIVLLVAFLLTGCGGGGSSTNLSGASTGAVVPAPNLSLSLRVACVGDSITAGGADNFGLPFSYPVTLQSLLGSRYEVRNFGVPGVTALAQSAKPYESQAAFQGALAFKADVVVIGLGTNDAGPINDTGSAEANGRSADFVRDYEALIAAFRKANPRARVYVCLPPPLFLGPDIHEVTLRRVVTPLLERVATSSGAGVIDLFTPLAGHKALFPDGVHPNREGSRLIAEAVRAALISQR